MQDFVSIYRKDPEKSRASERIRNFREIYEFFRNPVVAGQASRCVQCGDPFCSANGCPLSNYIPQWLEAIADQDLHRAFALSNESSPFPEILGRVCPQNSLCEGACTLDDGYGAISIGAIEASITDLAFEAGMELRFPGIQHARKVAVVGSGPAGISCAHFLLRAGIEVHMYERAAAPGGLLMYGIPGFKLDKDIVRRRFDILKRAGLQLHLGVELGVDCQLDELQSAYDAVFLGLGATRGRRAGIPGEDGPDAVLAMEFLTQVQKRLNGEDVPGDQVDVRGRRVVVIGGGDTAMDCVRTAVREGARTVTCLYRRDEANMPGNPREYRNAIEEGVLFGFNESPLEILRDSAGRISGVRAERTRMGEAGADGRQRVEIIPQSAHDVAADVIIFALGFDVDSSDLPESLDRDRWGNLVTDPSTGATSVDALYAGGDCQRGADLVVTAAADGRAAAMHIMQRLLG